MLDLNVTVEVNPDDYPPLTFREELPTLPYDLSEYALTETGPASWSAQRDCRPVPWPSCDDPFDAMTIGSLLDVRSSDVPSIALPLEDLAMHEIDAREARVLSLLDGRAALADILLAVGLPDAEVLAIVCDLCARGIVSLRQGSLRPLARRHRRVTG